MKRMILTALLVSGALLCSGCGGNDAGGKSARKGRKAGRAGAGLDGSLTGGLPGQPGDTGSPRSPGTTANATPGTVRLGDIPAGARINISTTPGTQVSDTSGPDGPPARFRVRM
jgi:hypothetical protein